MMPYLENLINLLLKTRMICLYGICKTSRTSTKMMNENYSLIDCTKKMCDVEQQQISTKSVQCRLEKFSYSWMKIFVFTFLPVRVCTYTYIHNFIFKFFSYIGERKIENRKIYKIKFFLCMQKVIYMTSF